MGVRTMDTTHYFQRLCLSLVVALSLLFVGCATRIQALENTTTTVVLIRHAEKAAITKQLTDAGHDRAAALPEAVADLQIVAIYSPNLARNLDTARPLADKLALEINVVADEQSWEAVAQSLISDHPGKTVLWVGNRGNLIKLFALLGGKGEPPLEYGQISILRVSANANTQVEKRHFGNKFYN